MSTIILIYILHIYYSLKYALFNTGIRETAFIYTYTKFARSTFYNRIPYSIEEPKELYAIILYTNTNTSLGPLFTKLYLLLFNL